LDPDATGEWPVAAAVELSASSRTADLRHRRRVAATDGDAGDVAKQASRSECPARVGPRGGQVQPSNSAGNLLDQN